MGIRAAWIDARSVTGRRVGVIANSPGFDGAGGSPSTVSNRLRRSLGPLRSHIDVEVLGVEAFAIGDLRVPVEREDRAKRSGSRQASISGETRCHVARTFPDGQDPASAACQLSWPRTQLCSRHFRVVWSHPLPAPAIPAAPRTRSFRQTSLHASSSQRPADVGFQCSERRLGSSRAMRGANRWPVLVGRAPYNVPNSE